MSLDLRVLSTKPITPPSPLPHVSRRALRRVRHAMPKPDKCPNCGGEVELVNNKKIYGRSYGEWPYAYRCRECDSYVGLHPHTDLPLGTLADKQTRDARTANKAVFNELLWEKAWLRNEAYAWLAEQLDIPVSECHWGMFSREMAEAAGSACEHMLEDSQG